MRVMLADDSALFRQGLALLLTGAGIEVCAEARTPDEAVARAAESVPDLVVLDIRMPPTHTDEGVVAARELRRRHPEMGILLLSAHVEPALAERLLAETDGRAGYLLKDRVDDVETLTSALRRIQCGEAVLDAEVVSELFRRRRNVEVLTMLSEREREVLALMAEGRSNAGIAESLQVAVKTVEANVARIFGKLGLGRDSDPAALGDNRRVRAVLAWLRAHPIDRC